VNICANSVTWTLLEAGKIKNKKKEGKRRAKAIRSFNTYDLKVRFGRKRKRGENRM
jgi:hypothetical protein